MGFDEFTGVARDAMLCVVRRRLRARGKPDTLAPLIARAFDAGDSGALSALLVTGLSVAPPDATAEERACAVAAVALAATLAPLRGESVHADALVAASASAGAAADAAEAVGSADMAYNLHEFAWTCADLADAPALESAIALRRLANPQRPDQVHAAAWRLAIEQLRDAIERVDGWLGAIDAVELALTLPVEPASHQQRLFERLCELADRLEATPISALMIAIHVQAPAGCLPDAVRRGLIERLLGLKHSLPDGPPSQAAHFMACLHAQAMLDDQRLALLAPPPLRPGIAWHDLTLAHHSLQAAVPLGRALVADPERTGELVLTLAHEATHAFCLLGSIGAAVSACRAGISYLEFLLLDVAAGATGEAVNPARATPLASLPADERAIWLALAQAELARRATRLAAAWTPWLEGVALYFELLADPAQDDDEILAPHEAVRSLVDFAAGRAPGESDAAVERRAHDAALEFERFVSAALTRHSRLRHNAALAAGNGSRVYLPGYLLVRALVARWEATLGRHIAPLHAARLLLDATRNGSAEALPTLDMGLEDFDERCRNDVARFVTALAAIDADTLERLVAGARPRQRLIWHGGQPRPARDGDIERRQAAAETWLSDLADQVAAVALGGGCPGGEDAGGAAAWRQHRDGINALLRLQLQLATLLPVGGDDARVLMFPDSGRIATCPRTFAGLGPVLPVDDDLNQARYSIRSFVADDPAREIALIRAGCAAAGSARARMTRVVDLVGRPDAPAPAAGMSYACAWLDGHWDHIAVGYHAERVDEREHAGFLGLLRTRLEPHEFHVAEGSTLASAAFLAERLAGQVPDHDAVVALRLFDAEACAADDAAWLLATALGRSASEVAAAIDKCCADDREAHALSHALWVGATGREQAASVAHGALAALVLDGVIVRACTLRSVG